MATITVNIQDTVAREFREAVRQKMGEHKGVLGKAIEEALKQWIHEKQQRKIGEEAIALMEKGIYSLKGWKFNREELYDRY